MDTFCAYCICIDVRKNGDLRGGGEEKRTKKGGAGKGMASIRIKFNKSEKSTFFESKRPTNKDPA